VEAGASEIVVLDNFSRGCRENIRLANASGRLRIVEGDVRDASTVARAVEGATVVFHQAAIRITQCAEEPRLAKEVLVDGTFNVLEAAVRAGVRKVVAASSASVYGPAEVFPTVEAHHPYANRTLYGAAKLFNEGLLRSFNEMYGLEYVALRYFNVYGPRMDVFGAYTEVLIRWMEAIAAGRPPVIFGTGADTMDFVHVEDIARANLLAATSRATDRVFNIGTGVETSLNALADTLLAVMQSTLRPEYAPPRKVNAVPRRLASIDDARHQLGFRSRISLEDGLRSLVAWWHEQPSATRQ
jgi:nucleoside-diphosphate-sugar epimerase